jgi:hypothetical protein
VSEPTHHADGLGNGHLDLQAAFSLSPQSSVDVHLRALTGLSELDLWRSGNSHFRTLSVYRALPHSGTTTPLRVPSTTHLTL